MARGGSLTAYKANFREGPEPRRGSWAWRLEQEAARIHQVSHVIACASGTVALSTLLCALYSRWCNAAPQMCVVAAPALTFSATIYAIKAAGLTARFHDVEDDGLLRHDAQEHSDLALTVDLFGKVREPAGSVVDACQSVGVPPRAPHGVWSFNGRKNVPVGEGGAIFTADLAVAARCRLLIGHAENFGVGYPSGNGHMSEPMACLAYHGMRLVRRRNAHRTRMARILNTVLADEVRHGRIQCPDLVDHALYVYPLVLNHGMPKVADCLRTRKIACQPGYIQPPLHRYGAFRELARASLRMTEALSTRRLLIFPQVTPTATPDEMYRLGESIRWALHHA